MLACGGEISYRLSVRQGDSDWEEVGRQTVSLTPATDWLRLRLAAAPNPANPRTTIELWLPQAGAVELSVYDVRGRQVARLLSGVQPAGRVEVAWDGRDGRGRKIASGVYLVQVRREEGVATERVALVR